MKTNRFWMLLLLSFLLGACTDFSKDPVFAERQLVSLVGVEVIIVGELGIFIAFW